MRRKLLTDMLVIAILTILVMFCLLPLYVTIIQSQKEPGDLVHHFWSFPNTLHLDYYIKGFKYLIGYIKNSLMVCSCVVGGVLFLSMISGYVFARLTFPLKRTLFLMIIGFMFVPGILTLIPGYMWMKEFPLLGGNNLWGEGGSGLLNSRLVLVLPWISGGQILGIYLFRTFFEKLPKELFEAARMDGAGELRIMLGIVLPLSLPIMATMAILQLLGNYNEYIWPLVTISNSSIQVFSVGVTKFGSEGNLDLGPIMAGYVIGAIPLILVFAVGMKYYVEGLTKGALKA